MKRSPLGPGSESPDAPNRRRSPAPPTEAPNPSGLCMCGCGTRTPIASQSSARDGHVRGEHVRFVPGHRARLARRDGEGSNPSGLCMCGCGERTSLARWSDATKGLVRGKPVAYLAGHQRRRGPIDYVEQWCGHETPCWIWQRFVNHLGYGSINRDGQVMAHRWYFVQAHGPIPDGLHLDHLCRNPPCVNPDHLEPVTSAENTRRGRGTKLTAADVREIRTSSEPVPALARRYGVDPETVRDARAGRTWRDVA